MSDTTWTPEQIRAEADRVEYAGWSAQAKGINAAMLRQGAADRERVTALEANLATVDALRQAAEATKVELAGQVTALETEVVRLKEAALDHDCSSFGMCRQHATTAVPDSCLYCDLATLTAEHERLTARWEALRAWAQARYDETENLDDVANWAYERMMGRMNILERGDDHS